jgi:SAM-dependent methyltransferase
MGSSSIRDSRYDVLQRRNRLVDMKRSFPYRALRFAKRRVLALGTGVPSYPIFGPLKTAYLLAKNRKKQKRRLEIGPGEVRCDGFETLSIVNGSQVDYVCDAAKTLPFPENTFDVIYASHILEHIPWYQTRTALLEWLRILKKGGSLEIWVPDGLKICKTLVDYELYARDETVLDGWYVFNESKDPCVWASGRLFTYGDGTGKPDHPNWHRALFTERYLKELLLEVGFSRIEKMAAHEVRGVSHGWINLGIRGIK